jgi:hypothetical protein
MTYTCHLRSNCVSLITECCVFLRLLIALFASDDCLTLIILRLLNVLAALVFMAFWVSLI